METIIFEELVFVDHMLSAKTAKFTSLKNLVPVSDCFNRVYC